MLNIDRHATSGLHRRFRTLLSAALIALSLIGTAQADLVLTAPPRESAAAGEALYGPIARYLSQLLGKKVTYAHPASWRDYQTKMRQDKYDIVFDGPHFAAWRIQNLGNQAVARLPGSLDFVLVARKDDASVQKAADLVGQTVCTMPQPNLGGVTLYSMFPNPARQPNFYLINHGGFPNVERQFMAGKCKAAILRESDYRFLFTKDAAQMKIIQKSSPLPNQGITLSRRVSAIERDKIRAAFSSAAGAAALKPLFARFDKTATHMVAAKSSDYRDLNLLHDTMVFGW